MVYVIDKIYEHYSKIWDSRGIYIFRLINRVNINEEQTSTQFRSTSQSYAVHGKPIIDADFGFHLLVYREKWQKIHGTSKTNGNSTNHYRIQYNTDNCQFSVIPDRKFTAR